MSPTRRPYPSDLTDCALIGMVALVTIGVLTLTGGSEYAEFALVIVFFVSFLVGSYW